MHKKKITLETLRSSLNREEVNIAALPYFQLAALLFQFDLERFRALVQQHFKGYVLNPADTDLLIQHCQETYHNGTYALRDDDRKRVLQWLCKKDQIAEFVNKVKPDTRYPIENLLLAYLEGSAPPLSDQTIDQLALSYKITGWLEGTGIKMPDEAEINYYIKREELLYPLRLITKDFQGRKDALDYLDDYARYSPGPPPEPLLISGIGGIGKSTVIAKFILNHYEHDKAGRTPFVYIDFDRPGYSISEPLQLASEGLRQLAIQFPAPDTAATFLDIRKDIAYYLESNNKSQGKISKSNVVTRGLIYDSVSRQYLHPYKQQLGALTTPVLVILDSFEEAQFRASYSELNNLFNFLREVAGFIPGIRFILAGRDDLVSGDFKVKRYALGEFDDEAAEGFLASKGIGNQKLRQRIVQQLGGNPLSLKLAVNFISNLYPAGVPEGVDVDRLFEDIDRDRVQEQLVRRNLMHIQNEAARQIAFPGLLVRRLSPEIIQKILAVPCGLGPITLNEATDIFNTLQKESFLLTPEHNALVFRKDLRVALYDLIITEYGEKAIQIHDLTIEYYKDKTTPADKAEYLYHRLKRGDSSAIIDKLYSNEIRPFIENAMTELPLNARIHLARIMGITVSDDVVKKAKLREWEEYLIAQIKDILEDGDESGLQRKKNMLAARADRTNKSGLYAYEANVHLRLAEFDAAQKILKNARSHQEHQLPFALLHAQLYEYRLDFKNACKILQQFNFKPGSGQSLQNSAGYLVALMRNAKRTGQPADNLQSAVNHIFKMLSGAEGNPFFSQTALLRAALPRPYQSLESPNDLQKLDTPHDVFQVFSALNSCFLTEKDYRELHKTIKALIAGSKEMEQKLINKFNIKIRDISEPAVYDICVSDVLFFLEQKYEGNKLMIEEKFLDKKTGETIDKVVGIVEKPGINKDRFKKLIADGRTAEVIVKMHEMELPDQHKNDLILIQSRFRDLEQNNKLGMISFSEYSMQNARILNSLLQLIDTL